MTDEVAQFFNRVSAQIGRKANTFAAECDLKGHSFAPEDFSRCLRCGKHEAVIQFESARRFEAKSLPKYLPRVTGAEGGGGNHVTSTENVELIKSVALRGFGVRAVARLTGFAQATVAKYYPHEENIRCQCGLLVTHPGWCAWRVAQSPKRIAFLRTWAYRNSGLIVSIQTESLVQAVAVTLRKSNIAEEIVTHIDVLNAVKKHAAHLEDQLKEDLIQDMFLEVLENRTPLSELGAIIKDRVKAMRGEVSRFKFISLDSMVPGTEDLRLIDTIASDRFHF